MLDHEQQFFQAFTSTSFTYMNDLGITGLKRVEGEDGGLFLEDVTAFIQLSGVIQGGVILTVDHILTRALVHKFMLEEITTEEAAQYGVEVVSEIANIISGNALTDRDEHDIFFGTPIVIVSKKAELNTRCSRFLVQHFETESGKFHCIFIPARNKSELARIFAI
jgi:CheY-specific phosphatase CheX